MRQSKKESGSRRWVVMVLAGAALVVLIGVFASSTIMRFACRFAPRTTVCSEFVVEQLRMYAVAGPFLASLGDPTLVYFSDGIAQSNGQVRGDHFIFVDDRYALDLEVLNDRIASFFVLSRSEGFNPRVDGVVLGSPIADVEPDWSKSVESIEATREDYLEESAQRDGVHARCYGVHALGFVPDRVAFSEQLDSLMRIRRGDIKGTIGLFLEEASGRPVPEITPLQYGELTRFRESTPVNAIKVTDVGGPCLMFLSGGISRSLPE